MTHDQVRQLVRRINPIPDPGMLESVDVPVLDTERSMEMQVDERPTAEADNQDRWRRPLIGIAAAVVVLIGGSILINTGEDEVATPAPNASPLPKEGVSLGPGAYYADTKREGSTPVRGTFVIAGDGWSAIGSGVSRDTPAGVDDGMYVSLFVADVDEVETTCGGGETVPAATTAEALGQQFAAAGFIISQPLSQVRAFGQEGYHLAVEVPAGCLGGEGEFWHGPTFGRNYQAEGQILDFWFFDVEGSPVMVETTRPPESSQEIASVLNADLDTVLDTLVITP